MKSQLIFVPALAHIILIFSMYVLLLTRKMRAVKTDTVDLKVTALNCKAWPANVVKVSNNLDNQFQAPMMFYVLCFVLYSIGAVSTLSLILAWFFVFSRYLHAWVHVGSNYVPLRMRVFAAGMFSLAGMAGIAAYTLWAQCPC